MKLFSPNYLSSLFAEVLDEGEQASLFSEKYCNALRDNNIHHYRVKTFTCGVVREIECFPVWSTIPQGVSAWGKQRTKEAQDNANDKNRKKYVTRLANLNFTNYDLFMGYTYADEHLPPNEDVAHEHIMKLVRDMRKICKKKKYPDLKYIIVTEYGEGRCHHHMITNFPDRNTAESLWKYATRKSSKYLVNDENGLDGIAYYIQKEHNSQKKRYTPSRNLKKPEPTVNNSGKVTKRAVRQVATNENLARDVFEKANPGYKFVGMTTHFSDIVSGAYIYVKMVKVEVRSVVERPPKVHTSVRRRRNC